MIELAGLLLLLRYFSLISIGRRLYACVINQSEHYIGLIDMQFRVFHFDFIGTPYDFTCSIQSIPVQLAAKLIISHLFSRLLWNEKATSFNPLLSSFQWTFETHIHHCTFSIAYGAKVKLFYICTDFFTEKNWSFYIPVYRVTCPKFVLSPLLWKIQTVRYCEPISGIPRPTLGQVSSHVQPCFCITYRCIESWK